MKAIYPIKELNNRHEKRAFKRETNKIAGEIDNIQIQFEYAIFKAPQSLSYNDIYNAFIDEWMSLVDKIVKVYNLKHCFVDLHFFEKKYKSVI